ncbi:uncharacterized protein LOC127811184 isoform X2 [Diospyros lotus]|nr:uncharacterized protein LOC127811184 isoform X2 [Diospyros lotus]
MFKNGEKVQLKCLYCGKIFKGGGIHRIKEHLAGQKGNASTCLRVQPDVRLQMQESLNGVVAKKRKKQKIVEEMSNFNPSTGEVDAFTNQCGLNTEVALDAVPETVEPSSTFLVNREEEMNNKGGGRRKKGRIRKASLSANPSSNALITVSNTAVGAKRANNQVSMAVGRFLYDVGIPLDAAKSVYFQPMIDAIASQGMGVVAPSYHDLRNCILKSSLQEVRNDTDQCVVTWAKTGCSVLVDEWVSENGRTIVNFLAYCPEGITFLRSVDVSDTMNSPDALYELLKEVVEEAGIRNVLQLITHSEERYSVAAKRLTEALPTVYWTPCAAHCIYLILEDFKKLDWINVIFEQAKSMSRFIYNHSVVLNMMRRYTFGVDLVDVGATHIATDFTTLNRMVNIRHNLQSMVTSEEWMECPYSKKPEGLAMLDHISGQSFWSSCMLIVCLTDPLLRLLRLVGSEKRPAMGYVYAGIYRAKESIKKQLPERKDYLVYWNIIDKRWGQLQSHPLHAAGFYLNPKFFFSIEGDLNHHIRSSVYDCIEKLVPDPKTQDKIVKEISSYHNAVGDFARKMAIRARDTLLPDEWWSTYGGGCPNLARLAIRILSQTCSLMVCKPNWNTIRQMHEARNCLESQRLTDLVFVHYNLQLKQMARNEKEQDAIDPISLDNISIVGDWVVAKEGWSEGVGNRDWMAVDPPLGNTVLLGPSTDDVEELGAGFDDYEIFQGVKCEEEENGEERTGE